jgi:hypothetical protein
VSVAKSLNPTGFWMIIWLFVQALIGMFLGHWILAFLFFGLGVILAGRMLRTAQRLMAESESLSPFADVFPWEGDD